METKEERSISDSSSTLHEKSPYSELFWSVFPRILTEYGEILLVLLLVASEDGETDYSQVLTLIM